MRRSRLRRGSVAVLTALLIGGCAHDHDRRATPVSPTGPPTTSVAPTSESAHPATASVDPAATRPCSDDDLTVTSAGVTSADTQRRALVSFTNTSPKACVLVGYPGADLVTAAGGVLVHVTRRPANAAHHLVLGPGDVATADIQASAIDTATGTECGRIGTLVVIAPNTYRSHELEVNLPICDATISSVS
jgi:hypothetical protein